jgi:hypothetical protein
MENSYTDTFIVPLNNDTVNMKSAPIVQTYPYVQMCPIDGWYWDNSINDEYINTTSSNIGWTIIPKNDQGSLLQINPYVNRIYFNCYLYDVDFNMSSIPSINILFSGSPFAGTIRFAYNPNHYGIIQGPGQYTFVADIGTNPSNFGVIHNNGGLIKPLSFDSTYSGQTLSAVNVTTEYIENISIETTNGLKYKFILSDIFVETNNDINTFGGHTDPNPYFGAGSINYRFTTSTVNNLYYEKALSYLFTNFYHTPISKKVSPVFDNMNISQVPNITNSVPGVDKGNINYNFVG